MVKNRQSIIIGTKDALNLKKKRTLDNTPRFIYNCGGYALGTYSWYVPCDRSTNFYGYYKASNFNGSLKEYCKMCTKIAVNQMLSDFPDLRIIDNLKDVQSDEYAIAFRVSSDGDFHYIKKAKNGKWYHKLGASYPIKTMTEARVLNSRWCYRYDGELVLFAKKN